MHSSIGQYEMQITFEKTFKRMRIVYCVVHYTTVCDYGTSIINFRLPQQVVFVAEMGSSHEGYIALDDVGVRVGSCPSAPVPPKPCNFDSDTCGWYTL